MILILLFGCFFISGIDTMNWALIVVAWIAQIAISSGAYYWKSKSENLVKLPISMLNNIPEDMRDKADPNQIIASVISIGTNNNNH